MISLQMKKGRARRPQEKDTKPLRTHKNSLGTPVSACLYVGAVSQGGFAFFDLVDVIQSPNADFKIRRLRAKLYQKKRHHEKIQMAKQIKAHEERNVKSSAPNEPSTTPLPQYLLDRSNPTSAKALSSASQCSQSNQIIFKC